MDKALRDALATLTTGIYILTARGERDAHGMTASWVTQVSGDPPLVLVALDRDRFTHEVVMEARRFALNVVGHGSRALEDYFRSRQARVLANLTPFHLDEGPEGIPLLKAAMAFIACRVVATYPAGDHTLFVSGVIEAGLRQIDLPLSCHELPYVYLGGLKKYAPSPFYCLRATGAGNETSRLSWPSDASPPSDES